LCHPARFDRIVAIMIIVIGCLFCGVHHESDWL
jgi:hypothetical protein